MMLNAEVSAHKAEHYGKLLVVFVVTFSLFLGVSLLKVLPVHAEEQGTSLEVGGEMPAVDSITGNGDKLSTDANSKIALNLGNAGANSALIRISIFNSENDNKVMAGSSEVFAVKKGRSVSQTTLLPVDKGTVNIYADKPTDVRLEVLLDTVGDADKPGSMLATEPEQRVDTSTALGFHDLGGDTQSIYITGKGGIPAAQSSGSQSSGAQLSAPRAVFVQIALSSAKSTTLHIGGIDAKVPAGESSVSTLVVPDEKGQTQVSSDDNIEEFKLWTRGYISGSKMGDDSANLGGSYVPKSENLASDDTLSDTQGKEWTVDNPKDAELSLFLVSATAGTAESDNDDTTTLDIGSVHQEREQGAVVDTIKGTTPQLIVGKTTSNNSVKGVVHHGAASVTLAHLGDFLQEDTPSGINFEKAPEINIETPKSGENYSFADNGGVTISGTVQTGSLSLSRVQVTATGQNTTQTVGNAEITYGAEGTAHWEIFTAPPTEADWTFTITAFTRADTFKTASITTHITMPKPGEPVIAKNAYVIGNPNAPEGRNLDLKIIELQEHSILFEHTDKLQSGMILTAGSVENAPEGLLRKVVAIDQTPDGTMILTDPAQLTDAILQVDYRSVVNITNYANAEDLENYQHELEQVPGLSNVSVQKENLCTKGSGYDEAQNSFNDPSYTYEDTYDASGHLIDTKRNGEKNPEANKSVNVTPTNTDVPDTDEAKELGLDPNPGTDYKTVQDTIPNPVHTIPTCGVTPFDDANPKSDLSTQIGNTTNDTSESRPDDSFNATPAAYQTTSNPLTGPIDFNYNSENTDQGTVTNFCISLSPGLAGLSSPFSNANNHSVQFEIGISACYTIRSQQYKNNWIKIDLDLRWDFWNMRPWAEIGSSTTNVNETTMAWSFYAFARLRIIICKAGPKISTPKAVIDDKKYERPNDEEKFMLFKANFTPVIGFIPIYMTIEFCFCVRFEFEIRASGGFKKVILKTDEGGWALNTKTGKRNIGKSGDQKDSVMEASEGRIQFRAALRVFAYATLTILGGFYISVFVGVIFSFGLGLLFTKAIGTNSVVTYGEITITMTLFLGYQIGLKIPIIGRPELYIEGFIPIYTFNLFTAKFGNPAYKAYPGRANFTVSDATSHEPIPNQLYLLVDSDNNPVPISDHIEIGNNYIPNFDDKDEWEKQFKKDFTNNLTSDLTGSDYCSMLGNAFTQDVTDGTDECAEKASPKSTLSKFASYIDYFTHPAFGKFAFADGKPRLSSLAEVSDGSAEIKDFKLAYSPLMHSVNTSILSNALRTGKLNSSDSEIINNINASVFDAKQGYSRLKDDLLMNENTEDRDMIFGILHEIKDYLPPEFSNASSLNQDNFDAFAATLGLYPEDLTLQTVTTDASGRVDIELLPPGNYRLIPLGNQSYNNDIIAEHSSYEADSANGVSFTINDWTDDSDFTGFDGSWKNHNERYETNSVASGSVGVRVTEEVRNVTRGEEFHESSDENPTQYKIGDVLEYRDVVDYPKYICINKDVSYIDKQVSYGAPCRTGSDTLYENQRTLTDVEITGSINGKYAGINGSIAVNGTFQQGVGTVQSYDNIVLDPVTGKYFTKIGQTSSSGTGGEIPPGTRSIFTYSVKATGDSANTKIDTNIYLDFAGKSELNNAGVPDPYNNDFTASSKVILSEMTWKTIGRNILPEKILQGFQYALCQSTNVEACVADPKINALPLTNTVKDETLPFSEQYNPATNTLIAGNDGVIDVAYLPNGQYVLKEVGTLNGWETDANFLRNFTASSDGSYKDFGDLTVDYHVDFDSTVTTKNLTRAELANIDANADPSANTSTFIPTRDDDITEVNVKMSLPKYKKDANGNDILNELPRNSYPLYNAKMRIELNNMEFVPSPFTGSQFPIDDAGNEVKNCEIKPGIDKDSESEDEWSSQHTITFEHTASDSGDGTPNAVHPTDSENDFKDWKCNPAIAKSTQGIGNQYGLMSIGENTRHGFPLPSTGIDYSSPDANKLGGAENKLKLGSKILGQDRNNWVEYGTTTNSGGENPAPTYVPIFSALAPGDEVTIKFYVKKSRTGNDNQDIAHSFSFTALNMHNQPLVTKTLYDFFDPDFNLKAFQEDSKPNQLVPDTSYQLLNNNDERTPVQIADVPRVDLPYSAQLDTSNSVPSVLKTDQDGKIDLNYMPYGNFILKRIGVPENYDTTEQEISFNTYNGANFGCTDRERNQYSFDAFMACIGQAQYGNIYFGTPIADNPFERISTYYLLKGPPLSHNLKDSLKYHPQFEKTTEVQNKTRGTVEEISGENIASDTAQNDTPDRASDSASDSALTVKKGDELVLHTQLNYPNETNAGPAYGTKLNLHLPNSLTTDSVKITINGTEYDGSIDQMGRIEIGTESPDYYAQCEYIQYYHPDGDFWGHMVNPGDEILVDVNLHAKEDYIGEISTGLEFANNYFNDDFTEYSSASWQYYGRLNATAVANHLSTLDANSDEYIPTGEYETVEGVRYALYKGDEQLSVSNHPQEGVPFSQTANEDGEVVSGANGELEVEYLEAGEYTLREVGVPSKWKPTENNQQSFTISNWHDVLSGGSDKSLDEGNGKVSHSASAKLLMNVDYNPVFKIETSARDLTRSGANAEFSHDLVVKEGDQLELKYSIDYSAALNGSYAYNPDLLVKYADGYKLGDDGEPDEVMDVASFECENNLTESLRSDDYKMPDGRYALKPGTKLEVTCTATAEAKNTDFLVNLQTDYTTDSWQDVTLIYPAEFNTRITNDSGEPFASPSVIPAEAGIHSPDTSAVIPAQAGIHSPETDKTPKFRLLNGGKLPDGAGDNVDPNSYIPNLPADYDASKFNLDDITDQIAAATDVSDSTFTAVELSSDLSDTSKPWSPNLDSDGYLRADANGNIDIHYLPPGNYTLHQINTAPGYYYDNDGYAFIIGDKSALLSYHTVTLPEIVQHTLKKFYPQQNPDDDFAQNDQTSEPDLAPEDDSSAILGQLTVDGVTDSDDILSGSPTLNDKLSDDSGKYEEAQSTVPTTSFLGNLAFGNLTIGALLLLLSFLAILLFAAGLVIRVVKETRKK